MIFKSIVKLAGGLAKQHACSLNQRFMMSTTNITAKPIELYVDDRSPPVRSVLMLVDELGIAVNLVQVDVFKREQYSKDFLRINPQHHVPALRHGDLSLHDSHTILLYLAEKFASPETNLIPTDAKHRIKVIDRLFFNGTNLFQRDSAALSEIFAVQPLDISHHLVKLEQLYDVLEIYLTESRYMACDVITIADLSIVATLSTVNIILPVDEHKWPKLAAWFAEMRNRNSYKSANKPGLGRLYDRLCAVSKCKLYDYRG